MSFDEKSENLWQSYKDFSVRDKMQGRHDKRSQKRKNQGLGPSWLERSRAWTRQKRLSFAEWITSQRFLKSFLIFLGFAAVLLILIFTGALGAFYDWLISWTSDGRTWTSIMARNPWVFWVPALIIVPLLFFLVPKRAYAQLWLVIAVFLIGFLGGHVFW